MFLLLYHIIAIACVLVKSGPVKEQTVEVRLFYEALCPDCKNYYPEIVDVVGKLGSQLELKTYPYGNAKTTTENNVTRITCQHGPKECYWNTVHACAIDVLVKVPAYVAFINCLMKKENIAECGKSQGISTKEIEECAHSDKGFQLLKHYGEETQSVKTQEEFDSVPFAQVNLCAVDNYKKGELLKEICVYYKKKPEACKHL